MKRVVITGLGVVSSLGDDVGRFFESLLHGRSGVRKVQGSDLAVPIAAFADFEPKTHFTTVQQSSLDRATLFALDATAKAVADSRLELKNIGGERTGVYIGTGMGGAHTLEEAYFNIYRRNVSRLNPLTVTRVMANAPAGQISLAYGIKGPSLTYSVACASSAVAVGEAYRLIKAGAADIVLAGGTEALLTFTATKAWASLGTLAREDPVDPSRSCRPFSADRSGFVLAEGAAILVLEDKDHAERRGANIYAEVVGYGLSSDASHITKPCVEGQARAMSLALAEAGISPADVDYINAHGTATPVGDPIETQAIKSVFGKDAYRLAVSATKSMHGHVMGATGAIEFLIAILAIRHNALPPTAHLRQADPQCDLDYVPNQGRVDVHVDTAMSNSFAFGGTNAVLIAQGYAT